MVKIFPILDSLMVTVVCIQVRRKGILTLALSHFNKMILVLTQPK